MADEQRVLLERLMGKDALISPQPRRKEVELTSSKVCKSFLVGSCPYDLLAATKLNIGKCPNLHSEKHKLEYEYRTKKLGEKFPEFEYEYYKTLRKWLEEIDFSVSTALKRLDHTPEERQRVATVTRQLDDLDVKIGLAASEITHLGKAQEITMALKQTIKLEKLLREREGLAEQARLIAENLGQSAQQKLQVCEVCGAYLSRLDNDRRLADHFVGKIHLGYEQMRTVYNDLKRKYG
ncbi:hypothetical protein FT663_03541 [Candidozyma haemuli var. vulneris]|uniref:Uncharacterized protein n=1 Tax=Candidozyma haemuli TaxID=45357 RepID=A0A2V1B223_9ASCO|nr:hypothetical protein CXQ85_003148 [[Candida] haemuloni]KAF3988578.1 hypothetical protein FT662_03323 [[Candida] haemuloni var. vulneris]KAF3989597.1 hypothetical protein FT663_03541 [[Candida] haemuloni var. vulneris]PVH23411.1 hypothetical protein CXQ85_003148 [[Candida] haemuloni]